MDGYLLDRTTRMAWVFELYRLGQEVTQGPDMFAALTNLLRHIVEGFKAKSGSLALYDSATGEWRMVAGIDIPEEAIGQVIQPGESVLGWAVENARPLLLVGDISDDLRFSHLPKRDNQRVPDTSMCWPLIVKQQVIGVFSVNRDAGQLPFNEEDLHHGEMLSSLVSLAVQSIRLSNEQNRSIEQLSTMNREMIALNRKLADTQHQLLQSEKMASLGQLAAGIAHEINNPIGYVSSNLGTLEKYIGSLIELLETYEQLERCCTDSAAPEVARIQALKKQLDIRFVMDDMKALLDESREGTVRVRRIVQDLKDFSHVDGHDDWQPVDIHKCIDSTLSIARNELKYKVEIVKDYGELPDVECLPHQLNQVFMNMLVNAEQAIADKGRITIRTGVIDNQVFIDIEDTGGGIPPETVERVFEPFFTTKPVGTGTGLGLSLSYSIIQKHSGRIDVDSRVGEGTRFRIWLPVRQQRRVDDDDPDA